MPAMRGGCDRPVGVRMMKAMSGSKTTMQLLLRFASGLSAVEAGVACAGTALESRTIKTNGKAFLFLRAQDARLKLGASLPEAVAVAAKAPGRVVVGRNGWVQLQFDDAADPVDVYRRWIAESHASCRAVKSPGGTRGAGAAKKGSAKQQRARG